MGMLREPIGSRHQGFDPLQAVALASHLQTSEAQRALAEQALASGETSEAVGLRTRAHEALVSDMATALGGDKARAESLVSQLPDYQNYLTQYEDALRSRRTQEPTGIFGWGTRNVVVPPRGVTPELRSDVGTKAMGLMPRIFQGAGEEALVAGGGTPFSETSTGRAFQAVNIDRQARGERPISAQEYTKGLEQGRLVTAETQAEKLRPIALRGKEAQAKILEAQAPYAEATAQAQLAVEQSRAAHLNSEKNRADAETRLTKYGLGEEKLPPNAPKRLEYEAHIASLRQQAEYHRVVTEEARMKLQQMKDVSEAMRRGDLRGAVEKAGISGVEALMRMDLQRTEDVRRLTDDLVKARTNLTSAINKKDVDQAQAYASQANHLSLEQANLLDAKRTPEERMSSPTTTSLDIISRDPSGSMKSFQARQIPLGWANDYLSDQLAIRPTMSLPEIANRGAWRVYIESSDFFRHSPDSGIPLSKLKDVVKQYGYSPMQEEEVVKTLLKNPVIQRKIAPEGKVSTQSPLSWSRTEGGGYKPIVPPLRPREESGGYQPLVPPVR